MKKYTAIYVRRSVSDKDKDNNSLSIESQIADCKKELKEGEKHKIYRDDGKSAKDMEGRPEFMQMMADAEEGLIERIIIKKYDRFSRNTLDFLNASKRLKALDVGLLSITEKFDTTGIYGDMMITMVIEFAQIERRLIAERVTDAYKTRANTTGFYQGGKRYYGYTPERQEVNGVKGSVLVPSNRADVVVQAYKMYKDTNASLADIINHFKGIDISVPRKVKNKQDGTVEVKQSNMDRSHFSKLLESPLYVRADVSVYQYLFSQGYEMIDDVGAFDGVHGLFRHKRKDGTEYIKVGYHKGIVDADVWLAVQDKKSHNQRIPNNSGAKNSWLVGLTKCPHCGYSFVITYGWNAAKTIQWRYYTDNGAYKAEGCVQKRLKLKPDYVETTVLEAMKARLDSLEIAKHDKSVPDTETENLRAEVVRFEGRVKNLMDDYESATGSMRGRINDRVNEIESEIAELNERIRARARPRKEVDTRPLRDPLNRWDNLTTDEKNELAKTMIDVVYVSDKDGIDIIFSI